MNEPDIRVGDIWRRKRNGKLVRIVNPRSRVMSAGYDVEYLMSNGRVLTFL